MRKYFNIIGKHYYWCGNKNGGYGFREWRSMMIFLMKIDANACTLEKSSHIIFFSIRKISTSQTLPWWIPPGKFPPGIFPPMFLNITARVFYFFFFFHYCYCYHWYYLKDCFVILFFKSAEVFTFVKICQNEFLSEERQLMKWVGILKVRIFLVAVFRERGFSKGEFDGWGRPPEIFFPRTIFFIECTYSYFSKNYQ